MYQWVFLRGAADEALSVVELDVPLLKKLFESWSLPSQEKLLV